MYVIGKQAAANKNPNLFSRAFMGFTFAKIVFSILMILIFEKLNQANDRSYLIGFLCVYVIFTIYETMVFMKLSRSPQDSVE